MAGSSSYPGALDNFSENSPTYLGDTDATGRNHAKRHDDVETTIEAIETELGVNPSGTDATVAARLSAIEAGTNLASGSITSAKIADGTIATADLADSSVTTAKILDGAVTPIKLSAGYAAKTALYTLTGADQVIEVTSGTFTLTLPAAASWTGRVYAIINSGSGVVTLDGNAAELVGGAATLALSGRGTVRIVCTGTAWTVLEGFYWDETVGRRQFAWDTVNNRWQMVYGDTGWRDVSASLTNSWTGTLLVRRLNYTVFVRTWNTVSGASATADGLWTTPTGWTGDGGPNLISAATSANAFTLAQSTGSAIACIARAAGIIIHGSYATDDAWPATLPGTASGSIPFN